MKRVLCLLVLLVPALAFGQNPIQTMTEDMNLPHEAYPHGCPWCTHATVSNMFPPLGFTYMTAWAVLFEEVNGSRSVNTRIQVRNLKTYLLHKDTMEWEEAPRVDSIFADSYPEWEFGGICEEIDKRVESTGGVSIKMKLGQMVELLPGAGRAMVSPDVIAVYVIAEARLIPDDRRKPYDLYLAKYVMAVGGDWWIDEGQTPSSGGVNNPGIGFGRFKKITPQWRTFSMSTMR